MVVIASVVQLDVASIRHWCRTWNVTENQLRIAVARVGTDASRVRADIYGTKAPITGMAQSWGECFGRAKGSTDPAAPRRRAGRNSQAA